MFYTVTQPNINPDDDKRPTKARKRNTLYRDEKSKPHRTFNGRGIIGNLMRKK